MFIKFMARITRTAELIAAAMLAAIFIIFLLQIFTRYAPKMSWLAPIKDIEMWMLSLVPIGWTVNLISLLWVWLIFVGCSFFVRDRDHVIFDVFYKAVSAKWRRIFAGVTALMLVAAMAYTIGPTYEALFDNRLMELKKIQTLSVPVTGERIPIKWLFAPIILFMIATIVRYGVRLYHFYREGRMMVQPNGRTQLNDRTDDGGVS